MKETQSYKLPPASKNLLQLYTLMGEALAAVQLLEDALSHTIAMKKDIKHPKNVTKKQADALLNKYRKKYTLGDAIKVIEKESLFGVDLRKKLSGIRVDRNWLIHKCMHESLDGSHDNMSFEHCKDFLYVRIKNITYQCNDIQQNISDDLLKYSEDIGLDMSRAKSKIAEYYQQNQTKP